MLFMLNTPMTENDFIRFIKPFCPEQIWFRWSGDADLSWWFIDGANNEGQLLKPVNIEFDQHINICMCPFEITIQQFCVGVSICFNEYDCFLFEKKFIMIPLIDKIETVLL